MQIEFNKYIKNKIYILIKITILTQIGFGQLDLVADEIKEGQSIEWSPIYGVSGYTIEVKNDNEVIIEKHTISIPAISLKLTPGKYEFRISAINKFKKIGKVYPWKELLVKPVDSPIVKNSPRVYNPTSSEKKFEAKGLYLHRGTRVILKDKIGNTYSAKVEVIKDGTGIIITPPSNLPLGEFEVIYQNSRGKPFQDEILVSNSITPHFDNEKDSFNDRINQKDLSVDITNNNEKSGSKVFSMFWRQALIPGWGHYYSGHKYKGAFYFLGTLGLMGAVGGSAQSFLTSRSSYNTASDLTILSFLANQPNPVNDLFINANLESKFNNSYNKRTQVVHAQIALGSFYIVSLIHVLITGYTDESKPSTSLILESYPEIYDRERGTLYRTGAEFRF